MTRSRRLQPVRRGVLFIRLSALVIIIAFLQIKTKNNNKTKNKKNGVDNKINEKWYVSVFLSSSAAFMPMILVPFEWS